LHQALYGRGKRNPLVSRGRIAVLAAGISAAILTTGCGVQYRPVISAINPVGPAGQPTKFAVAVSNPNPQDLVNGYSITGNVITVTISAPNPFVIGEQATLYGFPTSSFLNGQTVTILAAGFSTTQFEAAFIHANVAATTESGIVSLVGSSGLVTFVDFSGDTILSTPSILTNPNYFATNNGGSSGYVTNTQGSLNFFPLSNPSSLITSNIGQTTLPVNAVPITISAITPANATSTLFIPEASPTNPTVAALNAGTAVLYSQLAVGPNPVYVVGVDSAARVYAISQGTTPGTSLGQISAIEATSATSLAVTATIPVGVTPVYGVMTGDGRRAFILNQGSGTISVINVISNALDTAVPSITIPNINSTKLVDGVSTACTAAPHPIWAGLSTVSSELFVLNQGDGQCPGSLTVINIPLCTNSTPVTNPNCNAANPVDATGFGQVIASVPLLLATPTAGIVRGVNPQMVSVLQDGTAAYIASSGSASLHSPDPGSVTAFSLSSNTLIAAIPANSAGTATASQVFGHPTTISATTGSPTGKVYVTSLDSSELTVIYTNTNTVETHIPLQGNGLRVLVTAP
jgi:YVTN family beta-propeller protein